MPDPNAVYDVLVREAGAFGHPDDKASFVYAHTAMRLTRHYEYRFMGALGFGGKYRSETNTVDCYPEDLTPERAEIITRTNAALAKARGQ